ncbi:MraY family glycosyltransferase [Streptosporangium sp. NPDC048047]|uniref:MraY family glycosyltransferase n=1 Tax=Streptosporangium sp. NPDC048047 TaxID=3155748 RepID=UPI0034271206
MGDHPAGDVIWLFGVAPAAFAVTLALSAPLGWLALRCGLTDRRRSRGVHGRPTPYLGGVAVALGTLVTAPWVLRDPVSGAVLAGALTLAAAGLVDDVAPLPPALLPAVAGVAAAAVAACGVRVTVTGGWLDLAITVAWLTVTTRSFSLLDNADGALAAMAVVAGTGLAMAAFLTGRAVPGVLLIAVAAAGLGFLWHNWAPARVLMGSAGSLFTGFLLTASAALLVTGRPAPHAAAGLVLPSLVALTDTAVVLTARLGGRPARDAAGHFSHRLRRIGLRPWAVAALPASLTAVTCSLNLAVATGVAEPFTAVVAGAGTCLVLTCGLLLAGPAPRPAPPRA